MKSFLVDQDGYYGEFGGAYVPEILHKCVEELTNKYLEVIESEEFKKNMAFFLKDGLSYPLARQKALEKEGIDSSFISSPNNILASEYMRAILRLNSKIQPVAIKREGNDYNQNSLSGCLSSATAIRKEIFEGNTENIKNTVPENAAATKEFMEKTYASV